MCCSVATVLCHVIMCEWCLKGTICAMWWVYWSYNVVKCGYNLSMCNTACIFHMRLVSMWRYRCYLCLCQLCAYCIGNITWLCIFQSISMCLDATIRTMWLQFMCVCVLIDWSLMLPDPRTDGLSLRSWPFAFLLIISVTHVVLVWHEQMPSRHTRRKKGGTSSSLSHMLSLD